jgi:hypothetical protein
VRVKEVAAFAIVEVVPAFLRPVGRRLAPREARVH